MGLKVEAMAVSQGSLVDRVSSRVDRFTVNTERWFYFDSVDGYVVHEHRRQRAVLSLKNRRFYAEA